MNIKSDALKTFIAQLAVKVPQGNALLQAQGNLRRTFNVTGENKITIFAEPGVDGRKVGTIEPGACFGVVEQKKSGDGRTYLRLKGDLGWTCTTSKKDVNKVVACEVGQPGSRPILTRCRNNLEFSTSELSNSRILYLGAGQF